MVIIDGDEGLVVLDPDARDPRRAIARPPPSGPPGSAGWPAWPISRPRRSTRSRSSSGATSSFPARRPRAWNEGRSAIGFYRTEFLFLNSERPPTEQEQFDAYASVIRSMQGRPVTIRTLDLGADKLVSYQSAGYAEPNPALGLRSLRISLRDPALFRVQLRAILRASTLGNVRIIFPLVSTLGEFRQARTILDDVASGADRRGGADPAGPAGRHHGRGSCRRRDGRSTGKGGGLLLDRNQ